MSYRLFLRMFKAGLQREAFEQLQLLTAVSFPHWEDPSARERYRSMLLKAAGIEDTDAQTAEHALSELAKLQMLFPAPPAEVLEQLLKRTP